MTASRPDGGRPGGAGRVFGPRRAVGPHRGREWALRVSEEWRVFLARLDVVEARLKTLRARAGAPVVEVKPRREPPEWTPF